MEPLMKGDEHSDAKLACLEGQVSGQVVMLGRARISNRYFLYINYGISALFTVFRSSITSFVSFPSFYRDSWANCEEFGFE